jgi:hypothetical protein
MPVPKQTNQYSDYANGSGVETRYLSKSISQKSAGRVHNNDPYAVFQRNRTIRENDKSQLVLNLRPKETFEALQQFQILGLERQPSVQLDLGILHSRKVISKYENENYSLPCIYKDDFKTIYVANRYKTDDHDAPIEVPHVNVSTKAPSQLSRSVSTNVLQSAKGLSTPFEQCVCHDPNLFQRCFHRQFIYDANKDASAPRVKGHRSIITNDYNKSILQNYK